MNTGEDYYVLHYKGENIEVIMHENNKEGSKNINEKPFRMRWDILSINKLESLKELSKEEIIEFIKEAMIARGYEFLGKQLPKINVEIRYVGGHE